MLCQVGLLEVGRKLGSFVYVSWFTCIALGHLSVSIDMRGSWHDDWFLPGRIGFLTECANQFFCAEMNCHVFSWAVRKEVGVKKRVACLQNCAMPVFAGLCTFVERGHEKMLLKSVASSRESVTSS